MKTLEQDITPPSWDFFTLWSFLGIHLLKHIEIRMTTARQP